MKNCEEWPGYRSARGYGRLSKDGKEWLAHRWVWTQAHGEIPPGQVVRHTCDNPACVSLEHLTLGTQADNMRDMVERSRHNPHQAKKTHCPQDHEYSPENTRMIGTERRCKTCERTRARERWRALHPEAKHRI